MCSLYGWPHGLEWPNWLQKIWRNKTNSQKDLKMKNNEYILLNLSSKQRTTRIRYYHNRICIFWKKKTFLWAISLTEFNNGEGVLTLQEYSHMWVFTIRYFNITNSNDEVVMMMEVYFQSQRELVDLYEASVDFQLWKPPWLTTTRSDLLTTVHT